MKILSHTYVHKDTLGLANHKTTKQIKSIDFRSDMMLTFRSDMMLTSFEMFTCISSMLWHI